VAEPTIDLFTLPARLSPWLELGRTLGPKDYNEAFPSGRREGKRAGVAWVVRIREMNAKEELRNLKARAQTLEGRLFLLERRVRQMDRKPRPFSFQARIHAEKCLGCGLCQTTCPAGAIVVGKVAAVLADRCLGCGRCLAVCPEGAITLGARSFQAGTK
jgi:ferredoxin